MDIQKILLFRITCTKICALLCVVNALITTDTQWIIAGAIFDVAASVLESPCKHEGGC